MMTKTTKMMTTNTSSSQNSPFSASSSPVPSQHRPLHLQLAASEAARIQLRDSLLSYLRTTPDPAATPSSPRPPQLWAIPKPSPPASSSASPGPEPPSLLVGDAPTLLVSQSL